MPKEYLTPDRAVLPVQKNVDVVFVLAGAHLPNDPRSGSRESALQMNASVADTHLFQRHLCMHVAVIFIAVLQPFAPRPRPCSLHRAVCVCVTYLGMKLTFHQMSGQIDRKRSPPKGNSSSKTCVSCICQQAITSCSSTRKAIVNVIQKSHIQFRSML
jgi:hypothetical protein